MWITEEKILQWSTQESTDLSSNAYNLIREKIAETEFYKNNSSSMEIYLQGSYANATNIRRDADVDIVCQCNKTFHYENSRLTESQLEEFNKTFPNASLTFKEYKDAIYYQLKSQLNGLSRFKHIEYGAKSIKIQLQNPNMSVDVVPCFQQRDYHTFSDNNPYSSNYYYEGITLLNTKDGDRIINYPKLHKSNGESKNSASNSKGKFKPSVRAIKKIRNLLEESRHLEDGEIPSYFIENLIFNVPDNQFDQYSLLRTFNNIVDFLSSTTQLDQFLCQHKQWKLFGSRSTQWDKPSAQKFISLLSQVKEGKLI